MSISFARKAIFRMLENVRHGALEVICPAAASKQARTYLFGEAGTGLRASLAVHHDRFFSRVLWGGDDAAGDSYVDGDWWSPDLVSLVRIAVQNMDALGPGCARACDVTSQIAATAPEPAATAPISSSAPWEELSAEALAFFR